MKAIAWIVSFSLSITIVCALWNGYVPSFEGQVILSVLAVVLFTKGYALCKEEFGEYRDMLQEGLHKDDTDEKDVK